MIETRDFQAGDAAAVSRILFESFKTFLGDRMANDKPRPPEELARRAGGVHSEWMHTAAYVALDQGKVIGYISVSADLRRSLGTLGEIGVDPASMAHGAGTALFQAASKFWEAHGVNKIYTCTSSINTRAQRYYARMGFVEEGRRRRHFFDDVDEISLVIFPRRESRQDTPITVRAMTAADVPAVAAFVSRPDGVRGWDQPRLAAFLETANDSIVTHRALVALAADSGAVVGAALANVLPSYRLVQTQFLCVNADWRRRGIGVALFQAAVADWKSLAPGLRKADYTLPLSSATSLPFALHQGFVVEEALSEQGGPGEAEIRLGKFFA